MVIAVGSGKLLENGTIQPLTVKAGDKILIGKYSGSEVKLDGEDHIILREDDVLADPRRESSHGCQRNSVRHQRSQADRERAQHRSPTP